MSRKRWVLVSAPGLPSWPKLWFDPLNHRAKVIARHATWRSHQLALCVAEVFVVIGIATLAVVVWFCIWQYEPAVRIWIILIALFAGVPAVSIVIRHGLRGPLARQVFATRTILMAGPDAIAFQSRLYQKPVVVWRKWQERAVHAKFIVQRDPDASVFLSDSFRQTNKNSPRSHLDEAMMIEVVLTTGSKNDAMSFGNSSTIQRTIPVTEVSGRLARKISMVFTAACILTDKRRESSNHKPIDGVDIDRDR